MPPTAGFSKTQSRKVTPTGVEQSVERISREEKKLQSRRRILDSARDVFFRDGFMLANLDEVATRAGVAKGTLYRYFESKADLYVAVLAENGMRFVTKMNEVAERGGPVRECLRSIGDFYIDHWTSHTEYFQIFWAVDNQSLIGGLPDAALLEVSNLWEGCLSILKGVLDRGVEEGELAPCDTWEVAYIFWTMSNALIQSDYSAPRKELRGRPLREVFRDAIDLMLLGISRSEEESS
jgi:AcrR family transcriptional regulator